MSKDRAKGRAHGRLRAGGQPGEYVFDMFSSKMLRESIELEHLTQPELELFEFLYQQVEVLRERTGELMRKALDEVDARFLESWEELGQKLSRRSLTHLLRRVPPEVRLEGLSLEERLDGLKPEERLKGLKPEERLEGLKPEERLEGLKPEERLEGLKPEERLEGLKPEDLVKGLSPEALEALKKLLH